MSGKHRKHVEYEEVFEHDFGYEDEEGEETFHLDDENHHHHERKCTRVKCGSQSQNSFCVPLTFDQELIENDEGVLVPLSNEQANLDNVRGAFKLKFNSSLSKAAYALYVYNARAESDRITAAHLHFGNASINGPRVVPLFEGPPRNVNGLLIKGLIDNRDVVQESDTGVNVNSLASLYEAIRAGNIYVNVHSERFPGGIIRGQIYLNNGHGKHH